MAEPAVRCVHLSNAPNQTGWLVYDPTTRRLFTAIHVRFVESETPGISRSVQGWDDIVPSFSDDVSTPLVSDVTAPTDDTLAIADDPHPPPVVGPPPADPGPPSAHDLGVDDDRATTPTDDGGASPAVDASSSPTAAQSRPRRLGTSNPYAVDNSTYARFRSLAIFREKAARSLAALPWRSRATVAEMAAAAEQAS